MILTGERLKDLNNGYASVTSALDAPDSNDRSVLCSALFLCSLYANRYPAYIRRAKRLLFYLRRVYAQSYLQRGAGLFFFPIRSLGSRAYRLDIFISCSLLVFQGERYIVPEVEGMSDVIVGDLFYQSLMEKGAFSGDFKGNQLLWIGWAGGYVGNFLEADALPIPTDFDYPECKSDADEPISYGFIFRMIEGMRSLLSSREIDSAYADFCGCYIRQQTKSAAKLISDAEVRGLYEESVS